MVQFQLIPIACALSFLKECHKFWWISTTCSRPLRVSLSLTKWDAAAAAAINIRHHCIWSVIVSKSNYPMWDANVLLGLRLYSIPSQKPCTYTPLWFRSWCNGRFAGMFALWFVGVYMRESVWRNFHRKTCFCLFYF